MIDEIVEALRDGHYSVGDRLPSERVLAEEMQVGRAAVREALSALQVMGVIERRVGDGTYISSSVEKLIDVETALRAIRENESLGEVWHARKILEVVLAKLAVEKATAEDLLTMRKSLQQIEAAIAQKNYDDYADADRDFHLSLAEAAKNPFLERALFPVLEITHQQLATQVNSRYMAQHGADMVERHRDILHALETKDKEGVPQIVEHHFFASEKLFLEGQG